MSEPVALSSIVEVITRTLAQLQAVVLRRGRVRRAVSAPDLLPGSDPALEPSPSDLAQRAGHHQAFGIRPDRPAADGRLCPQRTITPGCEVVPPALDRKRRGIDGRPPALHTAIAQHLLAGLDGHEQEQLVALLAKVATHAARPSLARSRRSPCPRSCPLAPFTFRQRLPVVALPPSTTRCAG